MLYADDFLSRNTISIRYWLLDIYACQIICLAMYCWKEGNEVMYCPGENCSKRDTCANHFGSGQLIDWSTSGVATAGHDSEGNYHPPHQEFYCGDLGFYAKYTSFTG